MGRPSKYNWEAIKLDYESGLAQAEIHRKHKVPYNRLSERVREWEVSEEARAVIKGFDNLTEVVTELNGSNPALANNVIDIVVSKHPEFKVAMMKLSDALFTRMDELIPTAEASEIPQLAKGIQTITDTLGITERHAPKAVTAIQVNTETDEKRVGVGELYKVMKS